MLALLIALATPDLNAAIAAAVAPCGVSEQRQGITVCARTQDQLRERYGLPREDKGFDPNGPKDSVMRERYRLIDGDGASRDLAHGSCSATGADGWTGCMMRDWTRNAQQHGHAGP